MSIKNIDWKPVGEFAKTVGKVVLWGALIDVSRRVRDVAAKCGNTAGYSDAVGAIMRSDMYSSDKSEATSVLLRDGDTEFYKAVINIANDARMFSCDKAKTIRQLCGEE